VLIPNARYIIQVPDIALNNNTPATIKPIFAIEALTLEGRAK
jgi:hypothetical protein